MKEQRRLVRRLYSTSELRKMFKIPNDEMMIEVIFNEHKNALQLTTLKDFDKTKGDK